MTLPAIPSEIKLGIGLGLVALAALWLLTRQGVAKSAAASVGSGAVNLAGGLAQGVVQGVVGSPAGGDKNIFNEWGEQIGIAVYDLTHTKERGGNW